MEKTWWKECVVYQIYPRSFNDSNHDGIGDINGIISKLDYLKLLGIDVIWLSPVYKSPNCDNGYDISDYMDIMEDFGTMSDFDALIEAAHLRNIKIVMDLVVNHTSDEHEWFIESKKSIDNPYHDYYIWKKGINNHEPNNWGSWFGGSAWTYSKETDMYYLHIFAQKQPDLNWKNENLRKDIYSMMNWWCEKGVDGFRMDVISMISKTEEIPDGIVKEGNQYGDLSPYVIHGPKVHQYLQEMYHEVLAKYDVMTVGETPGITVDEAKKYAGFDRQELNMIFQFEHMDLDFGETNKWNDKPPKLTELKEVMSKWQTGLHNKGWNSLFWNNHDQPRIVSRFGDDGLFWNKSAKMLALCLHMMQGTPYIYQGEEIGMTNAKFDSIDQYKDIESINAYKEFVEGGVYKEQEMMAYLKYKSRDNARTPMQWSDEEYSGFSDTQPWIEVNENYKLINAKAQINDDDSVFNFYGKLIELRKTNEVVVYGDYELLLPDSEELFVYRRRLGDVQLLVICNFTKEECKYCIPDDFLDIEKSLLISNYKDSSQSNTFVLRPYEALVYKFQSTSN